MVYIYDLVLNWSDKRRYEFFEWDENDEIEYVKKIPVFRIDNFDDILNSNIRVRKEFLEKLYNKAEVYGNRKTEVVNYACIFVSKDLTQVVAIEFNDLGDSIYKSNIYFLDLDDIFSIASKIHSFKLDYSIISSSVEKDFYLTRNELVKKRFLVSEINSCYQDNNLEKLQYIYYEVFGEDSNDIDKIRDKLLSSLDNDFNYIHDNLYNLISIPNI